MPELSIYRPIYDYSSNVFSHTPFTNNLNFNTELKYEDVQLLFIARFGWDEFEYINQLYKDDQLDTNKPLVIFTPYPDSVAVNQLYSTLTHKNVSVFSFIGLDAQQRETPLQAQTIIAIANDYTYYSNYVISCYVVKCKSIEFKYGKQMNFYGLIPSTDSIYHPFYKEDLTNIDQQYYQDFIIKITNRRQELIDSHIPMIQELDLMNDILDNLIIVRKPKLVLGGDIQQRNNNKDAFHDTIKSLLPILTNGFYFSVWELLAYRYSTIKPSSQDDKINIDDIFITTFQKLYDIIKQHVNTDDYWFTHQNKFNLLETWLSNKDILPIHSVLMIETLFEKIIPVIMMNFTSYVIYQSAINMKED
jgi:hypothetical protein